MLRLHEFTFWAGRLPLKFLPAYCGWHFSEPRSEWARLHLPGIPWTVRGVG